MLKKRLVALFILLAGVGVGYFVYSSQINPESTTPFRLGLDLSGGTHLVYKADVSNLPKADIKSSMEALRDTIERRVNLFGVSEPSVQTEHGSSLGGEDAQERLIIELPGVEDTQKAVEMLGKTPVLEFRMKKSATSTPTLKPDADGKLVVDLSSQYEPASITGAHLKRSTLQFGQASAGGLSNEPIVALEFTPEGKKIFAKMTKENVGRVFGIFLDGVPISTPVIREEIPGGKAIISGGFKPDEARELVRNLNFGALPVPISLLSSQTIGASLGADTMSKGVKAGIYGLIIIALFLIFWYRLPGFIATISLSIYIALMLAIFKLLPVTLTSAGIAGFILSIGLAVDANVLIFERMKEELREGKWTHNAIKDGFNRAWLSIRDGNLSSIITAIILFWFGTSMVEGFALVFGIGVVVSMFSAITITRSLLFAFGDYEYKGIVKFLFDNGLKN